MSDSYDDYESKMQLAEHAWEVKTEHDRAVELAKAYERGWNAALAQREWVGLTLNEAEDFYEKYTDRAELINAVDKFLEEKNNG